MNEYVQRRLAEISEEHIARAQDIKRKDYIIRLKRPLNDQERADLDRLDTNERFGDCIYVIPAREFVKIGVATDPQKRWKNFRCANPLIEPFVYVSDRTPFAYQCETAIHKFLADYCIVKRDQPGREWFKCNRYFAAEVAQQVMNEVIAKKLAERAKFEETIRARQQSARERTPYNRAKVRVAANAGVRDSLQGLRSVVRSVEGDAGPGTPRIAGEVGSGASAEAQAICSGPPGTYQEPTI